VEEHQQAHRQRGHCRPAVCNQQCAEGFERGEVGQRGQIRVYEQQQRHHELVGRQCEQECGQNHTVQPEEAADRVKKAGQRAQRFAVSRVGQQPDEHACRQRHADGAAENKKRAVEQRADQHAPDLRDTVGRQLEQERGGRLVFPKCPGEQEGTQQRHRCRQQEKAQHPQRRNQPGGGQEHRQQRNEDGKPSVAGHKRIGYDRARPFAARFDDAAAGYAAGVAADAHAHRQRLLAAGLRAPEAAVDIERQSRQEADILQQRKQREENRHRRQHYRHDPSRRAEGALCQQRAQRLGCAEGRQQRRQLAFQVGEELHQKLRRVIRTRSRQPEQEAEQQKQDRQPEYL